MLYNQTIELVEVTKLLERVPVDTMTFQNALGHDYLSEAVYTTPTENIPNVAYSFALWLGTGDYFTPTSAGQLKNQSYYNIFGNSLPIKELCFWQANASSTQSGYTSVETTISVINPVGETVYTSTTSTTSGNTLATVNLSSVGQYKVQYQCSTETGGTETATYNFTAVSNIEPSTPYTIATAIERILNAGLGNNNGAYTLDPDLYDMLNAISAPEFCITRKNLYEALLEIGGYGHVQGLPTLKAGSNGRFTIVSYDILTNLPAWTPSSQVNLNGYIDYSSTQDAESYCGGIEIYADNLVDNSPGGSVEQPFPKTVRTETSDLVINDNAAIIETEFPIWKVNTLTQGYVAKGQLVGDITPFVFEKSQYDNFSQYKGEFPEAKQYAFFYVQGQPNLYGLTLKPETATNIAAAIADFAAVAIAKRKGKDYNSSNGISAFSYQVSYTPMTMRRLRQYKANTTDGFPTSNVLFYNPSTNVADAKNLGSHAAAQLQKIGNPVRVLTYKIYQVADLPRKGMTIGDEIITQVDYAFEITHIKVTIYVTKYNRLSEYIGINSTKRFYEVSEKQSVQRALNYSFFATVGTTPGAIANGFPLSSRAVTAFCATFNTVSQIQMLVSKIGAVVCTAYDQNGNPIQTPILHAVSANGFGKSTALFFSYKDNYSAGNQAVYCSYTPSGSGAQKLQRAVPYGDELGRFYSLKMDFYPRSDTITISNGLSYNDQLTTDSAQGFCDALPSIDESVFTNTPFISLERVVDKNGGEQISVDFQIHFVANEPSYIVGNALGSRNAFVGIVNPEDQYNAVAFVCLPYQLSYNQEIVPISDIEQYTVTAPTITPVWNNTLGFVRSYVQIGEITNTTDTAAQSWACVSTQDGALLVGQNINIPAGESGGGAAINLNLQAV